MTEIYSGDPYRSEALSMQERIARTGKIGIELTSTKVGEKVPLLEAALTIGTKPQDIMLYTRGGAFTYAGVVDPKEWTSDESRCWKWAADYNVFPATRPPEIIISSNYTVRDPLDV